MAKGKGTNWTRPYHVCKRKGCNNWCWASQVPTHPHCSVCGKKWLAPDKPQALLQQPRKPQPPKPRCWEGGEHPNRSLLKVLGEKWSELGEATQEAFQAAGFRPKHAPPTEKSLLDKLLSRKGELPEDIQLMLVAEAEGPSVTPYEEGQRSSNALTQASHKYRQLARKKLDLQSSVNQAKEHLKAMVEEIQGVDKQMEEAKQAMEDAQSKLSEALEQGDPVTAGKPKLDDLAAFESIGKSLGLEFTKEQLEVLQKAYVSQLPPGLPAAKAPLSHSGPDPPAEGSLEGQNRGPAGPQRPEKPTAPDEDMKPPEPTDPDEDFKGRYRSPRRLLRGGSKHSAQSQGE